MLGGEPAERPLVMALNQISLAMMSGALPHRKTHPKISVFESESSYSSNYCRGPITGGFMSHLHLISMALIASFSAACVADDARALMCS